MKHGVGKYSMYSNGSSNSAPNYPHPSRSLLTPGVSSGYLPSRVRDSSPAPVVSRKPRIAWLRLLSAASSWILSNLWPSHTSVVGHSLTLVFSHAERWSHWRSSVGARVSFPFFLLGSLHGRECNDSFCLFSPVLLLFLGLSCQCNISSCSGACRRGEQPDPFFSSLFIFFSSPVSLA